MARLSPDGHTVERYDPHEYAFVPVDVAFIDHVEAKLWLWKAIRELEDATMRQGNTQLLVSTRKLIVAITEGLPK